MKVSSHRVRSPLHTLNSSCQTCHNVPEAEVVEKIRTIQGRTTGLIDRAAAALTDMLDAIRDAQAAGATAEQLEPIFELQKKSQRRLDYVSSEHSRGFRADQEAARILAESTDYARRAQSMALGIRAPQAPPADQAVEPVQGVTPTEEAPIRRREPGNG